MEIIKVKNRSVLDTIKEKCAKILNDNDIVVDMTIGNGNDTLFLAKLVSKGFVFGFDIQEDAINNTSSLLEKNDITNYKLFLGSHDNIEKYLTNYKNKINFIIFNLGYLPGGNKKIITKTETTLKAFIKSLDFLKKGGTLIMVFYPHEEGKNEALAVKQYMLENNINYNEYHNTDNDNAPYFIEIKKK